MLLECPVVQVQIAEILLPLPEVGAGDVRLERRAQPIPARHARLGAHARKITKRERHERSIIILRSQEITGRTRSGTR